MSADPCRSQATILDSPAAERATRWGNGSVMRSVNHTVARPGLQHAHHPDLPTKETRIGRQLLQCRRRTPEEQRVEAALVLTSEGTKLSREGEGDQEIGDGKQELLLLSEPVLRLTLLTGWTVAIATRVIVVTGGGAARTGVDMAAECLGAALLNCRHRRSVASRHVLTEPLTIGRPIPSEDLAKRGHRICSSNSLMTALARWCEAMVRWV
jgi:hypothetical protein